MMNLKPLIKPLIISSLFIILYGCGQPDPTDWYSYRDRNRKPVEVKYNSAEILPGTDKKDIIRVNVTWKNPGSNELIIDDEKFSLDVSDVKLNPENFNTLKLAPDQEVTKEYDFLLVSSYVDKTKYKLSFEDWAEIPVFPVRK